MQEARKGSVLARCAAEHLRFMFFDKDHLAKKYRRFLELGGGQELGRRLPPLRGGGRAAVMRPPPAAAACRRRRPPPPEAAAAAASSWGIVPFTPQNGSDTPPKLIHVFGVFGRVSVCS